MNKDKFNVVNYIKDFISFIDTLIINYPRVDYVLKDCIQNTSYDLLELTYLGNVITDKIEIQKQIVCKISMLDFYLETSYAKECISLKKLKTACNKLEVIRKLIYGWIKSSGS